MKVEKFGVGVWFALKGESKGFRLAGGSAEAHRQLEAQVGYVDRRARREYEINAIAEYELLKQPPKAYWDQIPDYDPYAARRAADRELESFNVMLRTLRTNTDVHSRPLDAICARQFFFDIEENWVRALLNVWIQQQPASGPQKPGGADRVPDVHAIEARHDDDAIPLPQGCAARRYTDQRPP